MRRSTQWGRGKPGVVSRNQSGEEINRESIHRVKWSWNFESWERRADLALACGITEELTRAAPLVCRRWETDWREFPWLLWGSLGNFTTRLVCYVKEFELHHEGDSILAREWHGQICIIERSPWLKYGSREVNLKTVAMRVARASLVAMETKRITWFERN